MFYFYILLFYSSSILLEYQYLCNKITDEYILSFLICLSYTNIYILNETYFKTNLILIENTLFLFIYFFIFIITLYSSIFYFLLYSMQEFRVMNHVYFIEN